MPALKVLAWAIGTGVFILGLPYNMIEDRVERESTNAVYSKDGSGPGSQTDREQVSTAVGTRSKQSEVNK